jgi:C1A family cysteine protease
MTKIVFLLTLLFSITANASWTTKSSWVSDLSQKEFKNLLGNTIAPEGNLDHSSSLKGTGSDSIDWRNKDGHNYLGPVMNQGNCGSCVAFAAIATVEAQFSISSKASWLKPSFSPQALFSCGGGACDRGWQLSPAAGYIKRKGIVDSSCAPYISGSTGDDLACKEFCTDQKARTHKIEDFEKPTGGFFGRAEAVKKALKNGPLMTSMRVYDDFVSYGGGIYKSASNKMVGGHAVSIVGFNDAEKYWIVRNSWGAGWGENGFVRVSYDDKSGIGSETYLFNVNPEEDAVTFVSPSENEYVSGVTNLKIQFVKDTNFMIKIKNSKTLSTAAIECEKTTETNCVSTLDTTLLENGKYELIAQSTATNTQSVVRSFTILNTVPEMSIAASGFEVDLSQVLKNRIEFNVNTTSTPVQIQKLEFVVQDLNGVEITTRETDVVLPKMKLGFRTNVLKNGKYVFFFRAIMNVSGKKYIQESNKFNVETINNGGGDTRG